MNESLKSQTKELIQNIFGEIDKMTDEEFETELIKHRDGDIASMFIELWEFGRKHRHIWK